MTLQEKIIEILDGGQAYTLNHLANRLSLAKSDKPMLESMLRTMERVMECNGRYGLYAAFGIIEGTVQAAKGTYCFVVVQDGDDLFIPPNCALGAMHGDRVLARLKKEENGERGGEQRGYRARTRSGKAQNGGHRTEGEIIKILYHANQSIVGELAFDGAKAYVLPSSPKLMRPVRIGKKSLGEAKRHQQVLCRVTSFPASGPLEGVIEEVLGFSRDKGVDMLTIIKEKGLRDVFPNEVVQQAEDISARGVDVSGREDLRQEKIFTIDGDDAKDLDDAVSVQRNGEGWILGVHIADVSHYVRSGSALDDEAVKRGTSVYFPDRVLPMLPTALSNGICSLNQGQDRLTLSVSMNIAPDGAVTKSRIFPSVIRSVRRLTYKQVTAFLRGDKDESESLGIIADELMECQKLYRVLKGKRVKRGAVDFDLTEPHFTLDENGRAIGLEPRIREVSNEIIEQFMLEANECVAAFMIENGLPALYRVHEVPDSERMLDLNEVLSTFGYKLDAQKPTPKSCAALLAKVKGKDEELLVSRMLLRSMKKARYSGENLGHFGLAADNYLHFTSPIRRYPDLIVHRMIHFYLDKNTSGLAKYNKLTAILAKSCSDCEVAAVEAERDADDFKKAEYAVTLKGQCFDGIISGLSASAMWVELPSTLECTVPFAAMNDDYYNFDKKACAIVGERTRMVYRMGDRVQIKIVDASTEYRRVEAELIKKL